MESFLVIGGILGLLGIASPALMVFAARAWLLLGVAFIAWAAYFVMPPSKDPWADFHLQPMPPQPAKPAAIPAPPSGTSGTFVPDVPHVPPAQGVGWDVDDTSGPWSEEPMRPPSARADHLLRRLHKAQGLEVGQ